MAKTTSKHNKRARSPEQALASVIADLETESAARHRAAILSLLTHGPFSAGDVLLKAIEPLPAGASEDPYAPQASLIPGVVMLLRGTMLAFLRAVAAEQGRGTWSSGITTERAYTFQALATPGGRQIFVAVDGEVKDVAVLQLVSLLTAVGISTVRFCSAPDCQRLYVKVGRRQFCSVKCQSRSYMRERRENDKRQRQRAARRRKEQRS